MNHFDEAVKRSSLVNEAIELFRHTPEGRAALAKDAAEAEEREFDSLFGANAAMKRSSFYEKYGDLSETERINLAMGLDKDARTWDELSTDERLDIAMGVNSKPF